MPVDADVQVEDRAKVTDSSPALADDRCSRLVAERAGGGGGGMTGIIMRSPHATRET
jgi:hypothetical protein